MMRFANFLRKSRPASWPAYAAAVQLFAACTFFGEPANSGLAGPCTETGNPTGLAGKVVDAGGRPVPGAKVTLLERNGSDTSGIAAAVARTVACRDGSFGFSGLANSTYALEASDSLSGTLAWIPKVPYPAGGIADTPALILKAPGGITGLVTRGPNPLPAGIVHNEKILVRLIHTDKSFLTDTSGSFQLTGIGEGVYRAAFTAVDGHYLTAYVDSVRVKAGGAVILPTVRLAWSPFVAPPTPAGLIIAPDSAGLVRLHWHPVGIDTPFHYQIERRDSLVAGAIDTLDTRDTLLVDTVRAASAGHVLAYRIRLVNRLLNPSAWSTIDTARASVQGPIATGKVALSALVRKRGAAAPAVRVIAYRIPAHPGSRDSLPLPVMPMDTILTGADGRVRFDNLPAGAYALEAMDPSSGYKAYRLVAKPVKGSAPSLEVGDTLELLPTGAIRGTASRQKAWVTAFWKGNESIRISLAGTPYQGSTGYVAQDSDSGFLVTGIPAGSYKAVAYALPEGYFLPDTQAVLVVPGDTSRLPHAPMEYNPDAPPLKPHALRITAVAGAKVTLQWAPAAGNLFFKGYVVLRVDEGSHAVLASAPVAEAAYTDDLTGIPAGTRLQYLVHVVTTDGKAGLNGGDDDGRPVPYQVPGAAP